jgi:DNA-binding MarR family transcriptional regulator
MQGFETLSAEFANEQLLTKIASLSDDIKTMMKAQLSKVNLSLEAFHVLFILNKLPDNKGCIISIHHLSGMDLRSLHRVEKKLIALGLISTVHTKAKNQILFKLTPSGKTVIDEIKGYNDLIGYSFAPLTKVEKNILYNLLNKVQLPLII